jgi:hypothetical protein
MQGRSFTFRIPHEIDECLPQRLKDLDMEKLASYFLSLACFDLAISKPHYATGGIHKVSPIERDRIYAELGRAYKAGETLGGSWLEARVQEAVEKAGIADPPPTSKVGQKIQEILAEKKK